MDSLADEFDIDQALDDWLTKEAAESGLDENDYTDEPAIIQRFQETKSPEDFEWLYSRHRRLIANAMRNAMGGTNLPKSAAKAHALKWYIKALETYNPSKGAQFKTWLSVPMNRMRIWRNRYQNIGYIPPDQVGLIPLMQERESALTDLLGRPPSDAELADDINVSRRDLTTLRLKKDVSVRQIGRLRKSVRPDLVAEAKGGEALSSGRSELEERMVMLHGSLSPEDQLVLEHTLGDVYGKETVEDPLELALKLNISPQKVRAARSRILRKAERY